MYQLFKDHIDQSENKFVKKDLGNGFTAFIPMKEGVESYQKYLEWLAEGNTPQPAD